MKAIIAALALFLVGCASGPYEYEAVEFGEMRTEMPCIERINWFPTIEAMNLAIIRAGYATYYSEEFGVYNKETECWIAFFVIPQAETQTVDIYNIGHFFTHVLSEGPHWHNPNE